MLASIFAGMGLAWLSGYACVAAAASGLLRRPRVRRTMDALTGTVLIGLGARLAIERR